MTLQRHLAERLDADADRRALAFYDRSRTATWISWGDLLAGAAGAAGTLAEAGARRGEPCVIVAGNDRFSAEALLGVLMLGGVPLLMAPPSIQGANSSLPGILAGIVDRVAPAVVVAADPKGAPVDQLAVHHPEVRFLIGRDDLPATTG
ncbi:MAG: AMP-binding protein, partial [Acidimicrobiia bacterium]